MLALHTLLRRIIDYAGLFPPAGLDMTAAVAEYAEHRAGPHRWALGRFVVPATRLDELARVAEPSLANGGEPWRLSALLGSDVGAGLAEVKGFNQAHAGRAVVEAVEVKAGTPEEVWPLARPLSDYETYVEIPITGGLSPLVNAVADSGFRAKVRTGGVTPDAFPADSDLAGFVWECLKQGAPFKATAGLHHPLFGIYPLTYERDAIRAPMFGFLNLFLMAALMARQTPGAVDILVECTPQAFQFDAYGVSWKGHRLTELDFARLRRDVAISFGSCSFREPIADLQSLGLL